MYIQRVIKSVDRRFLSNRANRTRPHSDRSCDCSYHRPFLLSTSDILDMVSVSGHYWASPLMQRAGNWACGHLVALHWDGRFDFDHNFDSDATLVDSDNKNLDHTRDILFWGRRRTRWRLGQSCNQARDSTAHRPLTLNIDARIRSRTFDHSLYPVKVKRLMDERARNNEYTLVDDLHRVPDDNRKLNKLCTHFVVYDWRSL